LKPPVLKQKGVKIAKRLWLSDWIAWDLFEALSWGANVPPGDYIAVLIQLSGLGVTRIGVYKWNGQRLILRRTFPVDEFLKRVRFTPPPWFTATIS